MTIAINGKQRPSRIGLFGMWQTARWCRWIRVKPLKLDLRLHRLMSEGARDNLLGYATLGLNMQKALPMVGCELVDGAPIALHVTPPHLYEPLPGRYNAVMSMWESPHLPGEIREHLARADMLIAPSWYCFHVFRNAGLKQPLAVVPLGLWSDEWPYQERTHVGAELFHFLWVSARNIRKGYEQLWQAWCQEFSPRERVALTIKTTIEEPDGLPLWWRWKNFTMDRRYLSRAELRAVYERAHVLIFPTMGEGFGLTSLEAMASGMLVISPFHTGQRDFLNKSVAWSLDTKQVKAHYGVKTEVPVPTIASIRRKMRAAIVQFHETKALRERASAVAHRYTWQRSAEMLVAALSRPMRAVV